MPRRGDFSPRVDTEETRRAILQAAHDLFLRYGYRSVTTRMVAEASGIKQPLLYYHFADKEALFLEVHREQAAISRSALERIATRQNEDIETRLCHAVLYLRHSQPRNMGLFFHEVRTEMTPGLREMLGQIFQECIVAPIMNIFADGVRTGFLLSPLAGGIPPRMATFLLLSIVSGLSQSLVMRGGLLLEGSTLDAEHGEKTDADLARVLVHTMLYGMVVSCRPGVDHPST